MNHVARKFTRSAAIAAVIMFVAGNHAHAAPGADESYFERSLARGSVEDVTPQQKYRSAIREAGGAYKESMRECAQAAGDARSCNREAKAVYERDMAEARRLLAAGNDSPRPN